MSVTLLLALALTVPLAGAVLIAMSDRKPNQRETVTLITAVALFSVVVALATRVLGGARPYLELLDILPGIALAFRIEPLGMMFALIASFLWIVNSIYSIGYMRGNKERHQTRFYTCFAVALWATMGVAFSANLLSLFVFYEVLTISTYPLVTHHGNEKAVRGGRTYLGILLTTSIGVMLPAIILTAYLVGTLDFKGRRHHGRQGLRPDGWVASLLVPCTGTGKAALMPIHRWLPAAMVAPTPVSALLHAVGGGEGRCLHRGQADRLHLRHRIPLQAEQCRLAALRSRGDDPDRIDHCAAVRQPKAPACLFDGEPALLRHHGSRDPGADLGDGRGEPYRRACVW